MPVLDYSLATIKVSQPNEKAEHPGLQDSNVNA